MVIKVRIPIPLQPLTDNLAEIEVNAEDVGKNLIGLVNYLDRRYEGIGERLAENGKIRRYVNFYVNEEDVRFKNNEETEIKDGDEVSIVPAVAGGSGKKSTGLDYLVRFGYF